LKRVREALSFSSNLNSEKPSPELLDKMVEFLAQYVTEPEAHDAKVEALWMASENEYKMLLRAVTGEPEGDANPTSAARLNAEK
jgi:hypothetical protein